MIFIYLGRFRPRHVRRPSAAHSRFGGEVHVCRKVWQTRKVTIRTLYWLYSQPSFAAPTINWSWRGSYSAGYALLYSRGTYSKWCFAVSDAFGQYHSKSSLSFIVPCDYPFWKSLCAYPTSVGTKRAAFRFAIYLRQHCQTHNQLNLHPFFAAPTVTRNCFGMFFAVYSFCTAQNSSCN